MYVFEIDSRYVNLITIDVTELFAFKVAGKICVAVKILIAVRVFCKMYILEKNEKMYNVCQSGQFLLDTRLDIEKKIFFLFLCILIF